MTIKTCETCQAKGERVVYNCITRVSCHLQPDVELVDIGYWCMQHIPIEVEFKSDADDGPAGCRHIFITLTVLSLLVSGGAGDGVIVG